MLSKYLSYQPWFKTTNTYFLVSIHTDVNVCTCIFPVWNEKSSTFYLQGLEMRYRDTLVNHNVRFWNTGVLPVESNIVGCRPKPVGRINASVNLRLLPSTFNKCSVGGCPDAPFNVNIQSFSLGKFFIFEYILFSGFNVLKRFTFCPFLIKMFLKLNQSNDRLCVKDQ